MSYIPPLGASGAGGIQGPSPIPQPAVDDVDQIAKLYAQFGDVYAQYMQETDPVKKQALANKMGALLSQISNLCGDLDNMKPPLPKAILDQVNDVQSHVKRILENMDQPTGGDLFQLGMQIGALWQMVNPR